MFDCRLSENRLAGREITSMAIPYQQKGGSLLFFRALIPAAPPMLGAAQRETKKHAVKTRFSSPFKEAT
jgi:hypothetical protein